MEQRLLAGLIRINPDDTHLKSLIPEYFSSITQDSGFEDIEKNCGQIWNPYAGLLSHITPKVNIPELNDWFGKKASVWLKYNPRFKHELLEFLNRKEIRFEEFNSHTLKVNNGNLEEAILRGWCRVQDLGSQESLNAEILADASLVWDTCCGGGGKSLLVNDFNPDATLYISDSRSQMVHNAVQRFTLEGKIQPFSGTANLSVPSNQLVFDDKIRISKPIFDTLICDVPCSGSGTWRRSPEMLSAFSISDLDSYVQKQRKIVQNAIPFLKPGGKLIYLTCSVFTGENEENSQFMEKEMGLTLIDETYCGGYAKDADFIYRAVFEK